VKNVSIFFFRLSFIRNPAIPIFPLNKLNHAGLSMLAVIAWMPAFRLRSIHFVPVFGAFKFHHSAP
jgi:hypothetical protein